MPIHTGLPPLGAPLAMSRPAPKLSIVAPVYGCSGCLEELCSRIERAVAPLHLEYEIVLVCDASPDDAWARMRELAQRDTRIVCLRLSRNFGQHNAISAGLAHARGERVVVLDCDLQDRPEEIPVLHAKADEGFDAVVAQRIVRRDGVFKRGFSRAFYATLSYLTGERYDPQTANFGIYSRRVVDAIVAMPESGRFFPLLVRWTGFPRTTVPVQHAERGAGRSGYTFMGLIRLALNVITSHSDRPLRMVAKLGLLFGVLSFVLVGLSVYRYLDGDIAVAGFTTIVASIWLVGGATIFCLGIVGLYVGRIFTETKQRSHYVVSEALNLSASSGNHPAP